MNTKPTCGPKPSDLHLNKKLFEETPACETGSTSSAASGAAQLASALNTMKSPKEGLDYFSCYRVTDKQFCHYRKTVAPYIELAARSSHLPFAVQACLFNRESGGFKPNEQKKEGGAMGYVMFMPKTLPGISDIISTSADSYQKSFDAKKVKITGLQTKLDAEPNRTTKTAISLIKQINNAKAENKITYSKLMARKAWDAYWADATPPTPTSITTASLNCPQVAFALAAVVQTRSLYLMLGDDEKEGDMEVTQVAKAEKDYSISINKMNEQDSAILLAAAYNTGPAGLASKCGGVKSIKDCLKNPSLSSETKNHIKSIQNCSTKGSVDAPSFKSDGTPQNHDCASSKCKS